MKADRRELLGQVLQSALERDPRQRAAFLDEACAGDETLRREVESLLSSHDQAGSFLETPPLEVAFDLLAAERTDSLIGQSVGPYQIVSLIGRGGMGEVYRATDTRLGRTVAIKFLPIRFSRSPELRQRMEREARAVSRLNHPHICTLYDIGRHEDLDYLVMEHIEGQTLAERLRRGALPLEEVLRYGIEIADALHAAHREGITHRDVKPGNVMVVKAGCKLLDFGLAKFSPRPSSAVTSLPAEAQQSPQTARGTILGTVQYIAPEQIEGSEVDRRADIFAFGAVLYEMATGRKAFEGKSQASLIAAILLSEPPAVSTLLPLAPRGLDHLVRRCLARDPEERWQTALDIKKELEWIAGGESEAMPLLHTSQSTFRMRASLWWGIAAIGIGLALTLAAVLLRPKETASNLNAHFLITAPAGTALAPSLPYGAPAVSPDGSLVVFAVTSEGKTLLYVRPLNSVEATPLAGTDNAHHPFWSPNNRTIGFFAEGKLKTVELAGGAPMVLCNVGDPRDNQGKGGTWNKEGDIVFAMTRAAPLYRISASGGKPEQLTMLDTSVGEESHRWPQFLPDGRHFLYLARRPKEGNAVYVGSLDSRQKVLLLDQHESSVMYAPPGYLLFVKDEDLMAQPFDAATLKIRGTPMRVAGPVAVASMITRALFSTSENGVLAFYRTGAEIARQMLRFDRRGNLLKSIGPSTAYSDFRLAPNGVRVAYSNASSPASAKLWVMDVATGSQSSFNAIPTTRTPVWLPDSSQIVFQGGTQETRKLYRTSLQGADKPELYMASDDFALTPADVSRDGKLLLIMSRRTGADFDLLFAPALTPGKLQEFLATPYSEKDGRFSPDSRWVAYSSDESGTEEVWVRAFPSSHNKTKVSTSGGTTPVWRGDGKEIVYLSPDRTFMGVTVETVSGGLKLGNPKPLFKTTSLQAAPLRQSYRAWDMSSDGELFYLIVDDSPLPITGVVNWPAELKR